MKTIKYIIYILTFSSFSTVFAQSKVGTSAVPFLTLGAGANVVAMGGAGVSMNTGSNSLYWNPGVSGLYPKSEITFNQTGWLVGTTYNWIGATIALSDASVIGLQISNLDFGEEKVTTEADPGGNGYMWNANDLYFGFTYSQALTTQFSLGATVKYIRSKIYNEKASAYALDLGLLYVTDWNGLRLGMSICNLGTDIKYEGKDLLKRYDGDLTTHGNNEGIASDLKVDPWPLPILFRVGVSMEVLEDDMNKLTLALDALRPSSNDESLNVGTEYSWSKMIFLRAGYKSLFLENSQESYTFGFGLKYPISTYNLKYDFGYQKFDMFGDIITNGISIEF